MRRVLLPALLALPLLAACAPTPSASVTPSSAAATPAPAVSTPAPAPEPTLVISQESAGGNSSNVVQLGADQEGGVVIRQVTHGEHSANVVVLGDASDQAAVAGHGNVVIAQHAQSPTSTNRVSGAEASRAHVQVVSGNGNVVISSDQ